MNTVMSGFTRRSGESPRRSRTPSCRATMDLPSREHRGRAQNDWMEFQAGYIGGALLMPYSEVHCGR